MKHFNKFFLLLSLLVCVSGCRTTRNASTSAQSDFVEVSHETDSASESQTLALLAQRIFSLSIDSLFFMLSPDGLTFEVAETASPLEARTQPESSNRQRKNFVPTLKAWGIHLTDSTGLQSDSKAVSSRNASAADSTRISSAMTQKTSSQKSDASFVTTLKWILWLMAIGVVIFLIWKVRKALPI